MAKPAKLFISDSVFVSVFKDQREGKNGPWTAYNVSIQRGYKDEEGKSAYTSSLSPQDLGSLALILPNVWAWMNADRAKERAAKNLADVEDETTV